MACGDMVALLLGKPFHGETRAVSAPSERLVLTVVHQQEKKYCPAGQSAGVSPRREVPIVYVRDHSAGLPAGALVYRRRGYEPQAEDEDLVRQAFG